MLYILNLKCYTSQIYTVIYVICISEIGRILKKTKRLGVKNIAKICTFVKLTFFKVNISPPNLFIPVFFS